MTQISIGTAVIGMATHLGDGSGEIVSEGTVISEPSAIAAFIKAKAGSATRIGLQRHHAEGIAPPAERTVNPAGASRES